MLSSISISVLAYRNRAFARGIRHPEMLVPVTAHAAFDKAAKVLQMRIRHIPVDKNQRVNVGAMKRAISNETCMVCLLFIIFGNPNQRIFHDCFKLFKFLIYLV